MLRVGNLSIPLSATEEEIAQQLLRRLRIPREALLSWKIHRKSVDARDKGDVHFVLTVDVTLREEAAVLRRLKPGVAVRVQPAPALRLPRAAFARPPLVVGAGPAGLFAALTLAQAGARPILIERGKAVEKRALDVERMSQAGELDPESNVQFGEGGAGAFSDGKLTTGIKSPHQQTVLETFVRHGAPEEILVLAKPHIGTDLLRGVVASLRGEILRLGGQVLFETRLVELTLQGNRVAGAVVRQGEDTREIATDTVLLCIGHSARDTMQTLFRQGVHMVQKPFAMGVRIEHPQKMIDRSQYGRFAGHPALRAAEYKLAVRTPDGRGCYTFCMCPGGEVIAAASQPGGVAVNGMSYHARAGENANAAVLGECFTGAARGLRHVLMLTLGTGVGGSMVLDGRLYGGARGIAGELGHFPLERGGRPCTCGNRGCLEQYAATTALVRLACQATGEASLNGREIFARASRKDPTMLRMLAAWTADVAAGVTGLVHVFNPEMVLIGGGVSAQEALFLSPLRERVLAQVMPRFATGLRVERAALGNDAGLVGAAKWWMDSMENRAT